MTKSSVGQIITQCPKCASLVYLPTVVSTRTMLRCPKCQNQYTLETILPSDVPELQIVTGNETVEPRLDSQGEVESIPVSTKFEVPSILRYGSRRRRSSGDESTENGTSEQVPANETSEVESPIVSEHSVTEAPSISRSHRGRRSSRHHHEFDGRPNGTLEMVKVVIGAVMALPVAQLVIWWGLGLDPLGIGPSVGRIVPPLVPRAIRASTEEGERTVDLRNSTISNMY
ncbi:MAG: hypothetical protein ABL888_15505 [Pirellulaceae bacterium]